MTTTTHVPERLQPWLAALDARPQGGPRWLHDLRVKGAERFAALGFPTTREEEWRFTSVAPLAATRFRPAPEGSLAPEQLDAFLYAGAPYRIVIVNGRFVPQLSRTKGLPEGVRFGSLAAAVSEDPDALSRYLARQADFDTRSFPALNTAFLDDGAYLHMAEGVVVDEPLQLLFVTVADGPVMCHPRALIVAGANSQARIIETFVGNGDQAYFSNAVTEIFVGENAIVDHYSVQ